jgi:hypothetical protein
VKKKTKLPKSRKRLKEIRTGRKVRGGGFFLPILHYSVRAATSTNPTRERTAPHTHRFIASLGRISWSLLLPVTVYCTPGHKSARRPFVRALAASPPLLPLPIAHTCSPRLRSCSLWKRHELRGVLPNHRRASPSPSSPSPAYTPRCFSSTLASENTVHNPFAFFLLFVFFLLLFWLFAISVVRSLFLLTGARSIWEFSLWRGSTR